MAQAGALFFLAQPRPIEDGFVIRPTEFDTKSYARQLFNWIFFKKILCSNFNLNTKRGVFNVDQNRCYTDKILSRTYRR